MKKEKTFRVRLKHYEEGRYYIQYAHYHWLPIWHNIIIFLEGSNHGLNWVDLHLSLEKAEDFASQFKSYDNVLNLFAWEQKKEKEYKEKKKEEKEKKAPFKVKEIKIS